MFRNPVFDPNFPVFASKTGFFDQKTGKYFRTIFSKFLQVQKRLDISKKFPNFDNQTILKLEKTKSSRLCKTVI
jgi:hypothetical protein